MSENNQDPFKKCITCGSEEIAKAVTLVVWDKPEIGKICPVCTTGVVKQEKRPA